MRSWGNLAKGVGNFFLVDFMNRANPGVFWQNPEGEDLWEGEEEEGEMGKGKAPLEEYGPGKEEKEAGEEESTWRIRKKKKKKKKWRDLVMIFFLSSSSFLPDLPGGLCNAAPNLVAPLLRSCPRHYLSIYLYFFFAN